jgi:hypothetical protein
MRRTGVLAGSVVCALTISGAAASGAGARAALFLSSHGSIVADGTPASGALNIFPCASFGFTGVLGVNGEPMDEATFTATRGTDMCEGVLVHGTVSAIKLTGGGRFVVDTHIVWEELAGRRCVYVIRRLQGAFAIPGPTRATLSASGRLAAKRSDAGCEESLQITEASAALYDGETDEPFQAEL